MPTHSRIDPLNYSAHAIEDLHAFVLGIRHVAPQSAAVIDRLIVMLRDSVKFILPNTCDLLDPDDLKQAHLDLLRLPYPCVAFEAPWVKEDAVDLVEFHQTPATKRIALCWDARPDYEPLPGLNSIVDQFPEGGVFVVPIYWTPAYNVWMIALGGAFVPYHNTVRPFAIEETLPASRIAFSAVVGAGLAKAKTARQFQGEPFYLLPEFYQEALESYGGDLDKTFAQIMLDTRDEMMMLIQACSVMNCANVGTATVEPVPALNKKRLARGKQPFFSYRVLQLTDEARPVSSTASSGTHASPRTHLRRGHLRRLQSRLVWVRPTMVAAASDAGFASKDYAVGRATHSGR